MFLSLLPTKNAKMDGKHSILGNKRTLRKTCIISVLKFHKNHKGINAKTRVYRGFLHTKMMKCMNNTFNRETELPYQIVYFECFSYS